MPARTTPLLLGAALVLAGCAAPAFQDGAGKEEAVIAEKATRVVAGAWGFAGRVNADVEGSPAKYSADSTGVPGFSLEIEFLSREEGSDSWSTGGVLLEHYRSAEGDGPGRAEGALSGLYASAGFAGTAHRTGAEVPEDFSHRLDVLFGLRRGFVQAEVPDGFGGTYRRSSTWPEVVFGLRGEVSPVRRLYLFARLDFGGELTPSDASDESDGGDSSLGATTLQFAAGLRVRPAEHVSLLFGWRYLRLDGKEIVSGGTADIDTARVVWSGPWAGLEVDF